MTGVERLRSYVNDRAMQDELSTDAAQRLIDDALADAVVEEQKRIDSILYASFDEAREEKDTNVGLYAEAVMIYRRLVMEAG